MVKRTQQSWDSPTTEPKNKKSKGPVLPVKEGPAGISLTRQLFVKLERLDLDVSVSVAAPEVKLERDCLFCSATFSGEDSAPDVQRRATMEFVLGTTLDEPPETCSGCWGTFEFIECFKRSCLETLSKQGEMAASIGGEDCDGREDDEAIMLERAPLEDMPEANSPAAPSEGSLPEKRKGSRKVPTTPLSVERNFQCTKCLRLFVTVSGILAHKPSCAGKPNHDQTQPDSDGENVPPKLVCQTCEIRFPSAKLAKNHTLLSHNPQTELRCPQCPKVFHKKANYDNHINMHEGNRPFACRIDGCTKAFSSKHMRSRHERLAHSDRKECEICGAKVAASGLWGHMATHREGRHICNVCNRKFTFATELKAHQAVHTTERNNECKDCGKMFKTKDYLRKHTAAFHGGK